VAMDNLVAGLKRGRFGAVRHDARASWPFPREKGHIFFFEAGGGAIERSPLFRSAQTRSPEFESQRDGSFRTEGRIQRMQACRWTGTEGVPSRERDSHRPNSSARSLHGCDPLDEHFAELDPHG
jgi:hypothetical protein